MIIREFVISNDVLPAWKPSGLYSRAIRDFKNTVFRDETRRVLRRHNLIHHCIDNLLVIAPFRVGVHGLKYAKQVKDVIERPLRPVKWR